MDIDKEAQTELNKNDGVKKSPRKPRPSEIAAKKAKAAKKKKPAVKKAKPKAEPKTKKKPVKKTAKKTKRPHGNGRPLVRTERLDLRLTKQEKAKVSARMKKTGLSATGVVMEAIAKIK